MLLFRRLAALVLLCAWSSLVAQTPQTTASSQDVEINIIPHPAQVTASDGVFTLDHQTRIFISDQLPNQEHMVQYLVVSLDKALGKKLSVQRTHRTMEQPPTNIILILLNPDLAEEAYRLTISPDRVVMEAASGKGVFYAALSLLQLIDPARRTGDEAGFTTLALPCLDIRDQPRFPYRAGMLDVSRHFFQPEFIKTYIDILAAYKINYFHWHLTDDQGWRIESQVYPKLNTIGSWRTTKRGETYGGYYTKDQIRDIVQYAAERYVTIIPEIEMPGHCTAALAAYPEVSCDGGPYTIPSNGGIYPGTFCPCMETTYQFLENVLDEIIPLFPGPFVHVGGDEVMKNTWRVCETGGPGVNKTEEAGDALFSYFNRRIAAYLVGQGKEPMGWDGILEGGPPADATIVSWQGSKGGRAAAQLGHNAVMAPVNYCYFDAYQTWPRYEAPAQPMVVTLRRAYEFNPDDQIVEPNLRHFIIGGEACVWTEYIRTADHVEYMMLPRVLALAEAVWTPRDRRDWTHFNRALQYHLELFRLLGINYAKGTFHVNMTPDKTDGLKMVLSSEQYQPQIRYTTDGSSPTSQSALYTEPFPMTLDEAGKAVISAAIFENGLMKEQASLTHYQDHLAVNKAYTVTPVPGVLPAFQSYHVLLTDGGRGNMDFFDGEWVNFEGTRATVTLDLGQKTTFQSITTGFQEILIGQSYSYLPSKVVYQTSDDGLQFKTVATLTGPDPQPEIGNLIKNFDAEFEPVSARYVRVIGQIVSTAGLPPGRSIWMSIDEVLVQ